MEILNEVSGVCINDDLPSVLNQQQLGVGHDILAKVCCP